MQDNPSTLAPLLLAPYLSSGKADLASLNLEDLRAAAAQALALGDPALAARWSPDPLVQAAALLRLGWPQDVLKVLEAAPPAARRAALHARALWQLQDNAALLDAEKARSLARQEGDAGAIIACAALLGEMQLAEPRLSLRTLAEGLKVAEMVGEEADAYLLAVLAHAQQRVGGIGKARQTAAKALGRSPERSPARVVALLALDRPAEAKEVAVAGTLGDVWWTPFSGGQKSEARRLE